MLCYIFSCSVHTVPSCCVTYVFVSLDVFEHGPLLVIPVVSSLSVGLELLDGGGGGPARADPVHRGRDSLAEPRLDGPYLAEDLEQDRLHALVHAALRRQDAVRTRRLHLGAGVRGAAVSHRGATDGRPRKRSQRLDRWEQLQGRCEPGSFSATYKTTARTRQRQPADDPAAPATRSQVNSERYLGIANEGWLLGLCKITTPVSWQVSSLSCYKMSNLATELEHKHEPHPRRARKCFLHYIPHNLTAVVSDVVTF